MTQLRIATRGNWLFKKSTGFDAFFLSFFTILVTFHPFYLHGKLNLFELGIYLPGIQAILDGAILYRDFFYLRGPLELYVPAVLMRVFGESIWVLETYFYIGTVITLLLCVFLAKELYKTRLVFYLLVPVLVARTFPRVVFTCWGGMRYALGLLSVLFMIYFLKQRKSFWVILSAMVSGLALLTSVEIGVCAIFSAITTFLFIYFFNDELRPTIGRGVASYLCGLMIISVPYAIYLVTTNSFIPYFEATYFVVTKMTKVFPDFLGYHFKHLTPACFYLFLGLYFSYKIRKERNFNVTDLCVIAVASYGVLMYVAAFRNIGAAQFEMALMPEKILLFFFLEAFLLFVVAPQKRTQFFVYLRNFFIFILVGSSIGYSIQRYNHRFFAFKFVRDKIMGKDTDSLIPLDKVSQEAMALDRVKGLVVPTWQAEDFKQLKQFIDTHTNPKDPVFMFPELGSYSFIVDRPFVGRFPMVTFSWIGNWHEELFEDLKKTKPRYVVVSRDPGEHFSKIYFKVQRNKENYDEIMAYINNAYTQIFSTESLLVYERK